MKTEINNQFNLSICLVTRLLNKNREDKKYRKRMLLRKKEFPMFLYSQTRERQIKRFKKEQLEILKENEKIIDICKKELKLLQTLKQKAVKG